MTGNALDLSIWPPPATKAIVAGLLALAASDARFQRLLAATTPPPEFR